MHERRPNPRGERAKPAERHATYELTERMIRRAHTRRLSLELDLVETARKRALGPPKEPRVAG
jgi:hypothetical protein